MTFRNLKIIKCTVYILKYIAMILTLQNHGDIFTLFILRISPNQLVDNLFVLIVYFMVSSGLPSD